jgi:hypothetical protein
MRCFLIIFSVLGFLGCSTSKEYKLYRRDKRLNYPAGKLRINIVNDTTGFFTSSDHKREILNQKFAFKKSGNFLVIRDVSPSNPNVIALTQGDTIVVHKNRLLFFYRGDKKYLLYFKKKLF